MVGAGLGLIADLGGIPAKSLIEFKGGRLSWTWSWLAFHNVGFVIHLYNGRAFICVDLMDYKQTGASYSNVPSADFINTTLRVGQKISQHRNHRIPQGYSEQQLQALFEHQNCLIGSLIDDVGELRVFAETFEFVEHNLECLCEYDLNHFTAEFAERFDERGKPKGFAHWSGQEKVEWAMCKLKWDPANTANLGVAILDMIMRDLHICCTMTRDDRFDSAWYHDLIVAAKAWFFADNARELEQARIQRADALNKELFYLIEDFQQEPWTTINVTELEISQWIHVQWRELHELGVSDEDGPLDERPTLWITAAKPWSLGWWYYLRRVDKLNLANGRPKYVSARFGPEWNEWGMPYLTSYNGFRSKYTGPTDLS